MQVCLESVEWQFLQSTMLRLIDVKRNVLFTSDDGQSSNYWNPWKTDVFRQRCSCANENLTRICVTSLEASLPFRIVIMVSNVKWTSTCSHLSNIHNGLVSHWIIEIIEKIDVFRRRCSCLNEPQNLTRNGERISRNIHSDPPRHTHWTITERDPEVDVSRVSPSSERF